MASPNRCYVYRVAVLLVAVLCFYNLYKGVGKLYDTGVTGKYDEVLAMRYGTENGRENLGMTERECRATFPGLMREIDESVSRGPFLLERANDDYMGLVQGRIADGKVCCFPYSL